MEALRVVKQTDVNMESASLEHSGEGVVLFALSSMPSRYACRIVQRLIERCPAEQTTHVLYLGCPQ